MINLFGKTLVFVQLGISMACLGGGFVMFVDKTDWGWQEPRKFHDLRVASELDKRVAAVRELALAVKRAEPQLEAARKDVKQNELKYGVNHFYYRAKLAELYDSPKLVGLYNIERDSKGMPKLTESVVGVPLFVPIPEVKTKVKSLKVLEADLAKIDSDINKVITDMPNTINKMESIAFLLTGKDAAQQQIRPSLYDILQNELDRHERIAFEKEYLLPLIVDLEDEVDLYTDRKERLEKNLRRLQNLAKQLGLK